MEPTVHLRTRTARRHLRGLGALGMAAVMAVGTVTAASSAGASPVPSAVAVPAVASDARTLAPAARAASAVSLAVSHAKVRKNEAVWVAGKVKVGGSAAAKRKVSIQVRKPSGTWVSVGEARTRADGRFSTSLRVTRSVEVRARVGKTSTAAAAVSAARNVATSTGSRTLADRKASLAARAGAFKGKTAKLSKKQRTATRLSGLTSVRYRSVTKGMLVETTTRPQGTATVRTWLVSGKILKAYRAADGPKGRYGVPVGDARCGLSGGGCVQRFSRGVLYSSASKSKATGTSTRGARGEVFAAARSQLGYSKRAPNTDVQSTKFNRWMGSSRPWCSFFVSWSFAASGHRSSVPQEKSFAKFRAEARRTMKIGKTPKVGALAFLDTRPPAGDNHVAIVVGRSGKNVTIVEGNMGAGWGKRGVITRTIPARSAAFYAYPTY